MLILRLDYYVICPVNIVMDVKNQQLFTKPLCEYCIFEMALWKL